MARHLHPEVRMAARMLFLLSVLCSPIVLFAQNEEEAFTRGWPNGRYWEKLDEEGKKFCIYSVSSGVILVLDKIEGADIGREARERIRPIENVINHRRFSDGDVAEHVTAFYYDRSNMGIPIAYAYMYAGKKLRGERQRNLDEFTSSLRKRWNAR
jgi:hypothetical protein